MKLKIDNEALAEEFFEGTRLLGIVAPLKDYQFCFHINRVMQLDFRLNHEYEIMLRKKQRKYYFAIYEYTEPAQSLSYFLYNNQFDGEYLLPEFKHLDFLWLLKGEEVPDDELDQLQKAIREIPGVQLVTELAISRVRNKTNLIF